MKIPGIHAMSIKRKGLQYWLPYYLWDTVTSRKTPDRTKPIHVMLCFVDHFEPFHTGGDVQKANGRVRAWTERYPKMAQKHKDADGKPPQHTWFYPPHLDHVYLKDLVDLCRQGYGEIEMHLHHNHMDPFPDTSDTLRQKIQKCIDDYSKYGIFCMPDGARRFAFIHGDWSLDNACGEKICGVNDEISILRECGCYADFTFPSLGVAQPSLVNRMYYVQDDPSKPKSYNWGRPVRVGSEPWGDLMMVQGVIGLRWLSRTHRFKPSIEASNIDKSDYPSSGRIDYLVRNAIRVEGQPNWLFIKIHSHGCREVDFDCLLGSLAERMYDRFESSYNDKHNFFLHYVTAREMYNMIKAAEAGLEGNPDAYRDYRLPKYVYIR